MASLAPVLGGEQIGRKNGALRACVWISGQGVQVLHRDGVVLGDWAAEEQSEEGNPPRRASPMRRWMHCGLIDARAGKVVILGTILFSTESGTKIAIQI